MADWAFLFSGGGETVPSFSVAGRLPCARGEAFSPAGAIGGMGKSFADFGRGWKRERRSRAGGRCRCDEVVERCATVAGTRPSAELELGGRAPGATSRDLAGAGAFPSPNSGSLINRPTDNLQRAKPPDISGTLPSSQISHPRTCGDALRVKRSTDSAAEALASTDSERQHDCLIIHHSFSCSPFPRRLPHAPCPAIDLPRYRISSHGRVALLRSGGEILWIYHAQSCVSSLIRGLLSP